MLPQPPRKALRLLLTPPLKLEKRQSPGAGGGRFHRRAKVRGAEGTAPACCPASASLTPRLQVRGAEGTAPPAAAVVAPPPFQRPGWRPGVLKGRTSLPPPFPRPFSGQLAGSALPSQSHAPRKVSGAHGSQRPGSSALQHLPVPPLSEGLRKGEGERSSQRTLARSPLPPSAAFPPHQRARQVCLLLRAPGAAGAHWGRPSLLKGTGDSGRRIYVSLGRVKSVVTGTSVYSLSQFGSPENKPICLPSFLWSSGLHRRQRAQIRPGTVHIHMIMYS